MNTIIRIQVNGVGYELERFYDPNACVAYLWDKERQHILAVVYWHAMATFVSPSIPTLPEGLKTAIENTLTPRVLRMLLY